MKKIKTKKAIIGLILGTTIMTMPVVASAEEQTINLGGGKKLYKSITYQLIYIQHSIHQVQAMVLKYQENIMEQHIHIKVVEFLQEVLQMPKSKMIEKH